MFPLLAATVPLIVPISKDLAQSRLLADDVTKLRHLLRDQPAAVQDNVAPVAIAFGIKFRVAGAILGLVLAFLWLFLVHENAN